VVHALPALGFADHESQDQVPLETGPALADRICRDDERGETALHVLDAVSMQPVPLDPACPWISVPSSGKGIDIQVPVEHPAHSAAGALHRGDHLKAPGLDLVELDLEAPFLQPLAEIASE